MSPLIQKALYKAALLHDGQKRKNSHVPYIVHPVSVAWILSKYTNNENIVAAGLLHDTIEDTGYTPDEMEQNFGIRVAEIVAGVSEDKKNKNGNELPWKTRKESYLGRIKNAPKESLLVSAADKIHNLQSMLEDYGAMGGKIWEEIKPGPERQIWFYGEVLKIIKIGLGDHEIVEELEEVYAGFKTQMLNVKTQNHNSNLKT